MGLQSKTVCLKSIAMSEIGSFKAVIELWPTREALAAELGEDSRLISKWWQRDKIPADRWAEVLALPTAASGGVTADLLTDLASRRDRLEVA